MSLDFGALLADSARSIVPSQVQFRAQVTWARILDMPVDIELKRGEHTLPIQTVRLEYNGGTATDAEGDSGMGSLKVINIIGVKGHPEIDDLDIKEWDTFIMDGEEFTVRFVNRTLLGRIKAEADVV